MKATVTLRALSWGGPPPVIGQYLRSKRGRTAYLIVEVAEGAPDMATRYFLECERRPFNEPRDGDHVHSWQWAKRERARR